MTRFTVFIFLLSLSSVSLAQDEIGSETAPNAEADGASITMHPKKDTAKPAKKKIAKKKISEKGKATTSTSPVKHDAETSQRFLINGNSRFAKKNFRADGRTPSDRERGLAGETPHSAILASSDSRIVPEIIFDQGLGELYTVRTFGESVDDAVLASLEYAVDKLNVPLLVVLANSDCAAMKLQAQEDESDMSDALKDVVDAIRPRLKTLRKESPSPSYEVEATLNADAIARELTRKSEVIRKAVESKKLKIKSALYRINTGRVTFY